MCTVHPSYSSMASVHLGLGFKMTTPSSAGDSAMYFSVPSSARSPAFSSTGVVCVWKPAIHAM